MKCLLLAIAISGCASIDRVEYAEFNYLRSVDAMQNGKSLNCASMDEIFWIMPGSMLERSDKMLVVKDTRGKLHTIWRKSNNVLCVPQ